MPVRIHRRPQHDDVVGENLLHGRVVRPGKQVVGQLRRHLRPRHLRRVAAAVDVDEGPAFVRQRPRLCVGQVLRMRQALGDLTQSVDLREVGRRRNQRKIHRPALCRLACLHQPDRTARGREFLQVCDRLIVCRQLVVGAGREPEDRIGRRDGGTRGLKHHVAGHNQGNDHACRPPHRRLPPSVSRACAPSQDLDTVCLLYDAPSSLCPGDDVRSPRFVHN